MWMSLSPCLTDDMDCAEAYLKHCVSHVLEAGRSRSTLSNPRWKHLEISS
jgi:hypothetical protein